jgi:hypothetical protein
MKFLFFNIFFKNNNYVSSFQLPSQALSTESLVLAPGKMGKKLILFQVSSPPAKPQSSPSQALGTKGLVFAPEGKKNKIKNRKKRPNFLNNFVFL